MRSPSLAMAPETDVRYGRINAGRWQSRPVCRRLNTPWGRGARFLPGGNGLDYFRNLA
jgi:hypothetical protein